MLYSLFILFSIIILLGFYAPKRLYSNNPESIDELRQEIDDLSFDLKRLKRDHEDEPDDELAREQHRKIGEIQRRIECLRQMLGE